jgi:hypothetical protein
MGNIGLLSMTYFCVALRAEERHETEAMNRKEQK